VRFGANLVDPELIILLLQYGAEFDTALDKKSLLWARFPHPDHRKEITAKLT
jgi:hypothetical protein